MDNKTLMYVVIVIVVLGVGYFLINRSSPNEEPSIDGAPQGKIDIKVVCENAVVYMSFPDGTSAEAFVQDCKEGKHPEVIEKFKADLNLGAGAEI